VIERPAEQRTQFRPRRPSGGERAQHGQRVHAFDEVVTGRLAEALGAVGDVEDVVDDLEHHAEAPAPLGQRVDHCPVEPGDDGTDPGRGGEQ
jgi:hypothetical protein